MNWFCSVPFSHIYTSTRGEFRLCCMASSTRLPYNINDDQIEDWWYSGEMNHIRKEFTTGKLGLVKTLCQKCMTDESNGVESERQFHNKLFKEHLDDSLQKSIDHFKETGEYKLFGRQLTLKLAIFGNHCNLSCYTCLPHFSTRRIADLKEIGWYDVFEHGQHAKMDVDKIYPQIEKLLPYTAGIVITGGEPLLMKKHYRFLDMIVESGNAKDIILSYTTNLTLLKLDEHNFLDYINQFKKVMVNVSIDGIGKRNDYIRYGSDWDTLIKNYHLLYNVQKQVYYTTSILSVFQCMEAIKYFDNIRFDQSVVDQPEFLSVRHLPDDIKEKLISQFTDKRLEKVVAELKKDRKIGMWAMAVDYIKDLDKKRDIKSYEIFTELADVLR